MAWGLGLVSASAASFTVGEWIGSQLAKIEPATPAAKLAAPSGYAFRPVIVTVDRDATEFEAERISAAVLATRKATSKQSGQSLRFEPVTAANAVRVSAKKLDSLVGRDAITQCLNMLVQSYRPPPGIKVVAYLCSPDATNGGLAGRASDIGGNWSVVGCPSEPLAAEYSGNKEGDLATVTLHEVLHQIGVDHVADPGDVMYDADLNNDEPGHTYRSMRSGYHTEHVRYSPYSVGPASTQRIIERTHSRKLAQGVDMGTVATGCYPTVPQSHFFSTLPEDQDREFSYVQKWEKGAIISTDGVGIAVNGPLFDRWQQRGAENDFGLPLDKVEFSASNGDTIVASQRFARGRSLSVEVSRSEAEHHFGRSNVNLGLN